MTGQSLDHALSGTGIPASPAAVEALLEAAAGSGGPSGVDERCGLDPALALAMLAAVNADRPVHDRIGRLSRAAERLGAEACRAVALSVPVSSDRGDDPDSIDFDFMDFRGRAIRASVAARHVAQATGVHDPEEAGVAALLQDIGMVAMHRAFGDRYLQVLDIAGRDHRNLSEVEQRTLRIDHALVGAELASRACLPPGFVAAIRHHHRHAAAGGDERKLASVLELASIAALAVDEDGLHAEDAAARFRRFAHAWLGLAPHEGLVVLEEIRAECGSRLAMAGFGQGQDDELLVRRIADARRAAGFTGAASLTDPCTHDALTGLPDRESFLERLEAALGRDRPRGSSVAVLVASVDDLRDANLRLGVRGGDALLRAVACRLAGSLPRGAEAFRLLGGQFAILAPGFSPLEARRLADDFRRQVASEQIDIAGERAFRVTLSVGASVDRLDLEHPAAEVAVRRESLVRSALAALAAAESIGRNRTEVHRDGRDAA